MKKYSWIVDVNTGEECTETDYDLVAGQMCNALVNVPTSNKTMQGLTSCTEWEFCTSEIEVSYNGVGVTGTVLIDMSCPKASLTKPKWLKTMQEAAPQWPGMSVTKRNA